VYQCVRDGAKRHSETPAETLQGLIGSATAAPWNANYAASLDRGPPLHFGGQGPGHLLGPLRAVVRRIVPALYGELGALPEVAEDRKR